MLGNHLLQNPLIINVEDTSDSDSDTESGTTFSYTTRILGYIVVLF